MLPRMGQAEARRRGRPRYGPSPTKGTTWRILGTADVNYLKPGQTIIFNTTLDDQGQPQDKVSQLTVVPAKGNKPVIKADDERRRSHFWSGPA